MEGFELPISVVVIGLLLTMAGSLALMRWYLGRKLAIYRETLEKHPDRIHEL